MRIGSLFSGAGGLDMAVEQVFGGTTVWHSEIDAAASKVLAYRWPEVPNLGDISAVDWATVPPVDILCGGFPCQDVSAAGKRAGIKDGTRSGLWSIFADAIDALRPPIVIIENVRGLLSARAHRNVESDNPAVGEGSDRPVLRALGAVLGDLADIGYDAQWTTLAAAEVGAAHRRERVFIIANTEHSRPRRETHDARGRQSNPSRCSGGCQSEGCRASCCSWSQQENIELLPTPQAFDQVDFIKTPEQIAEQALRVNGGGCRNLREVVVNELLPTPVTTDAKDGRNATRKTHGHHAGVTLTDAFWQLAGVSDRDDLLSTPQSRDYKGRPADNFNTANLCRDVVKVSEWGKYEPAIRRWEASTRPSPTPTQPNRNGEPRLNPTFSEWLMGWPGGWVTDPHIGISRNDQLRIIGNGVCPQQAVAALRYLLQIAVAA